MSLAVEDDLRAFKVYKEFKTTMQRYGKIISLPKNTDPKKTYSWRYVCNFMQKLNKEGIDDEMMPLAVKVVVTNAFQNGMINRGFAILNHGDILMMCKHELEKEVLSERRELERIKQSAQFVEENRNNKSKLECLLLRKNPHSYANITCWYEGNFISKGYIAVTKSSRKAIAQLSGQERTLFPTWASLIGTRLKLISVMHQELTFLGEDLLINSGGRHECCTART